MKTKSPLQTREHTKLETLYHDLDLFLTQPLFQLGDPEPLVAREIRKELGRLKSQVGRVEKALEGLPSNAGSDEVIEALEQHGILHSGRMSETE
jgi:hypothetical protein